MNDKDLFSEVDAAEKARDEGMERALKAAPTEWVEIANSMLHRLAREQDTLTADDVWDLIGPPPEPRALGAVMRDCTSIEATTDFVLSRRRSRHRAPIRVWRSTVRKGETK